MNTPIFEENDARELQGHRHHARRAQLRPVPAVRRAHVPRQGQGAEEGALADPGRRSRPWPPELTTGAGMAAQNLRAVGDRIEQLLDELQATADPRHLRRWPRSCSAWSTELYGGGLDPGGGAGARARARARRRGSLADELVASLLLVHGLHPESVDRPGRAGAGVGAPVPRDPRRRRRAARRRRGRRRGAPAAARQLRRLPVVGGHAAATRSSGRSSRPRPRSSIIDVEQPSTEARRTGGDRHAGDPDPQAGAALRELSRRGRGAMSGDPLAAAAAHPPARRRRRRRGRASAASCAASRSADEHGHLVDLERRSLMCACRGCYLLFTPDGAGGGHFRAVPDRYLAFPDFRLSRAAVGRRCRSR